MPSTTPDDLPYEQWPPDQPGHTLHGGTDGLQPILAVKTQEALTSIRGDLAPLQLGFLFGGRVVFTGSGTFAKGSFPGLRAVDVEVVGGGGGGGGAGATAADQGSAGGGGGGGGYSRRFLTIDALASSETVTVGAGGTGGAAGADGGNGGPSSLGTHLSAGGGVRGNGSAAIGLWTNAPGGDGGIGSGGDLNVNGDDGGDAHVIEQDNNVNNSWGGHGGGTVLGGIRRISGVDSADVGLAGRQYGGGGSGAFAGESASGQAGGAGAAGVVIISLYY